jgi:DNA/RNA-binding domain of Phe-tRNA-synthetase-like protein
MLESKFSAELENLLLTAGHALGAVQGLVRLEAAQGNEIYQTLSGECKILKPGDIFMADELGVISSVLYGPDRRTRLVPGTQEGLFTVYAVEEFLRELCGVI